MSRIASNIHELKVMLKGITRMLEEQNERNDARASDQFRICGNIWMASFNGIDGLFPNMKGFWHVHRLLRQPGVHISAVSLIRSEGRRVAKELVEDAVEDNGLAARSTLTAQELADEQTIGQVIREMTDHQGTSVVMPSWGRANVEGPQRRTPRRLSE